MAWAAYFQQAASVSPGQQDVPEAILSFVGKAPPAIFESLPNKAPAVDSHIIASAV